METATSIPRLGAICRPQVSPERMLQVAVEADRSGLAELWLWEDCFLEGGLTSAAAILSATRRVVVGIGLLPMPLRNVAVTAMEIATLERMFPGRVRVAVGHGVQPWMAQVGARARSPLGLAREYLSALRGLLAGESVTMSGDYVSLDAVTLGWPPLTRVPVALGAIGPKSLALAGECADGVLLDAGFTVGAAREAVIACLAARSDADRSDPFETIAYERFYRGPDAQLRLDAEARPAGISANADAHEVAARVRAMGQAGVQTVILMPSATETDPAGYLRFVAAEVAPRLSNPTRAQ
jgi:alkanesulfonate monooxygenase SsuD/methylene tetrahydromethanopterin reductase-like flavin-dependent oxidoreductase (luciferase family)